jgi:hypothetical protein
MCDVPSKEVQEIKRVCILHQLTNAVSSRKTLPILSKLRSYSNDRGQMRQKKTQLFCIAEDSSRRMDHKGSVECGVGSGNGEV